MRQAILITAYRDSAQLQRLVDYFDSDFELFIHIDRQSHLHLDGQHISSNVHVYQCYPTPWGSVNHLHAILLLMHEAARRQDLEYFHLATGSDYPIPLLPDFKSFCEAHREENYLEHFPLPRTAWDGEGGLERINYYWLQPWLKPSTRTSPGHWLTTTLVKLQRKSGLKRQFYYFDNHLYGGGTYWSISRQALNYAIEYLNTHPDYLRRFRLTKIAEEICLPSLWANSGLPFINNSLRYIDWSSDGSSPKVLDETDYDRVKSSGALFARKMQSGISDTLIKKLMEQHNYPTT